MKKRQNHHRKRRNRKLMSTELQKSSRLKLKKMKSSGMTAKIQKKNRRRMNQKLNRRLLRKLQKVRKKMRDRKSTRLNSSHVAISYAVFCLKKKKTGRQSDTGSRRRHRTDK